MNNNEKIINKTFLDSQKRKDKLIKTSLGEILGTDVIFFDDSIELDVVKKLSKKVKKASEYINSYLQSYSSFDN